MNVIPGQIQNSLFTDSIVNVKIMKTIIIPLLLLIATITNTSMITILLLLLLLMMMMITFAPGRPPRSSSRPS